MLANLPLEVWTSTRCVVWRYERRDGRFTKVPYCPTRPWLRAAVDRPATWGTFAGALAAVERGQADGVGIVLGELLVGVDLDHVVDAGTITVAARTIVTEIDSYTEWSPSRTGLHVLARGTLPPGGRRKGFIEMYDRMRYFTVTGEHVAGTPLTIEERTAALAALHRRIFTPPRPCESRRSSGPLEELDDRTLIDRALAARNGGKFGRLWAGDTTAYNSASEADLALVNLLAFWTGGDAARVDRLFRRSGLYRSKWDERRGGWTYGEGTIARALRRSR